MKNNSTVLLVDADHDLSQIVGSFLSFLGYRVNYTCRLSEALKKMELQRYECILIDPRLHDERGEEILRATFDAENPNKGTPVVVMTGASDFAISKDVVDSIKAVLPKPFSLEDLTGAIKTATSA